LQFNQLPDQLIPRAKSIARQSLATVQGFDRQFAETIVERWRGGILGKRMGAGERTEALSRYRHPSTTSP